MMKSQDVGLLVKLALLHKYGIQEVGVSSQKAWPYDWKDWGPEREHEPASYGEVTHVGLLDTSDHIGLLDTPDHIGLLDLPKGDFLDLSRELPVRADDAEMRKKLYAEAFTTRGLEKLTGISKSQVSLSLSRCYKVGLARAAGERRVPVVNTRALLEFIAYGLRYVFPVFAGGLERGVGTSYSAPVLAGQLMSSGELDLVWPEPTGKRKGLSVEPLYRGAVQAAMRDPHMYACLALIDAIRMGKPRERNLALELLRKEIAS